MWTKQKRECQVHNANIGENPMPQKPKGSSTKGESRPKIKLKGVVDGNR